MKNKHKLMIIGISIVILLIIVIGVVFLNRNKGNDEETFKYISGNINSELKGTYAFVTKQNIDETFTIYALKKDNKLVELTTTDYSDWKNEINTLFYSDGKVWFNDGEDIINSIDLTEGNEKYSIKRYEFLEGYITDDDWFYVKDNNIYYFNTGALRICNLQTEECEAQVLDRMSNFELELDGKDINTTNENVYIDDNMIIYLMTKDKDSIYKIDVNDTYDYYELVMSNYEKIDQLPSGAHLLALEEILENSKYRIDFKYSDDNGNILINSKVKNELEDLIPITLLPNDILMVQDFNFISLNKVRFFDLKTNQFVDNMFDYYTAYDKIWFVS